MTTQPKTVSRPPSSKVRDPADGTFVLTTRNGFSSSPGRCIGLVRGAKGGAFGGWNLSKAPATAEEGTDAQQLYSQVSDYSQVGESTARWATTAR
jgi:hypothetical protein